MGEHQEERNPYQSRAGQSKEHSLWCSLYLSKCGPRNPQIVQTPQMNCNVNSGSWVVLICQRRFIDVSHLITLGAVGKGEGNAWAGQGGDQGHMGNLCTIPQICCKLKTALRKKNLTTLNKIMTPGTKIYMQTDISQSMTNRPLYLDLGIQTFINTTHFLFFFAIILCQWLKLVRDYLNLQVNIQLGLFFLMLQLCV